MLVKRCAEVLLALGVSGLVAAFSSLIRQREGALVFAIGGVVLLAVGSILYVVAKRRVTVETGATGDTSDTVDTVDNAGTGGGVDPASMRFLVVRGYVALIALPLASIATTVWAIATGSNAGIPFLLWVGTAGFAAVFLGGRAAARDSEREQAVRPREQPRSATEL